jgi:hypothetical protein
MHDIVVLVKEDSQAPMGKNGGPEQRSKQGDWHLIRLQKQFSK